MERQGFFFVCLWDRGCCLDEFAYLFFSFDSLLNILGTIDKPTKGSLDICGVHVSNKTGDRVLADLRLHHIGFVFQTFNLLPALTAVENVEVDYSA